MEIINIGSSGCLIDAFRGETPAEFYIFIKCYDEGMPQIFGNLSWIKGR